MAENAELVRTLYELWMAGDEEAALERVDPGIEWVEPPDAPDSDTHRGPEGVAFSMARWREPFDHWTMVLDDVRDLGGGMVLVRGRQYGRGRGSDVEVEALIFHLWTIRDGRAARMQMFLTEAEALATAGTSRPEEPA